MGAGIFIGFSKMTYIRVFKSTTETFAINTTPKTRQFDDHTTYKKSDIDLCINKLQST